jgi:hypothetical protein
MKLRYSLLLILIALGLATSCADKKTESADSCEVMIDQQDYDGVINSSSCSRYYKASAYLGKSGFMLKTTDSPTVKSLPASSTGSSTPDTAGYSMMNLLGIADEGTSAARLEKINNSINMADNATNLLTGALTGDEKFINLFATLTSFQLKQVRSFDTGQFGVAPGSCASADDTYKYDGQLFENERECAATAMTCSSLATQIVSITDLIDALDSFTKSDTTEAICSTLNATCVIMQSQELLTPGSCGSNELATYCKKSAGSLVYDKTNKTECQ